MRQSPESPESLSWSLLILNKDQEQAQLQFGWGVGGVGGGGGVENNAFIVALLFTISVQNLITQHLPKTIPKAVVEKTSEVLQNLLNQCSL